MESTLPLNALNFHHLRYFWTVAREGGLRKAAEKLRVSQPSICTQVKLLEQTLGEKLFRTSGRSLVLTEFGQLIYSYAEEIFALGSELLSAAKQAPTARSLRLNAGIVDSFPKLMSFEFLRPVFEHEAPIQLTCQEGKLPDLMAALTTHRVDVVLADEPASPSLASKVFNHPLGSCGLTFCAIPQLARQMIGRFPRNLDQAPALLPTHNCQLRRDLENWFRAVNVTPRVVAEFEDPALTKIFATEGLGFVAVPTLVVSETIERYGVIPVGKTDDIQTHFYAITAERRLTHPAIVAITSSAARARQGRRLDNAPGARSPRRGAPRETTRRTARRPG